MLFLKTLLHLSTLVLQKPVKIYNQNMLVEVVGLYLK